MDTYEQKYNEALSRARDLHDNHSLGMPFVYQTCEDIFPELKENEDERIRKELIQYLKDYPNLPNGNYCRNDFFAWLEKQGEVNTEDFGEFVYELSEQFPEVSFAKLSRIAVRVKKWLEKQGEKKEIDYDEELKKCKDNPLYFYDKYVKIKLKEQGEQKPSWSEEDEERLLQAIIALEGEGEKYLKDYGEARYKDIVTWLKFLKDRVQPKQEWSEEDMVMIQDAIHWIQEFQKSNRCKDENDMQNSVTCENWLKSLKDRVQPQPKQEWSEEDEKMFVSVLHFLNTNRINERGKVITWVESLPKRFGLQPKREWSEEDEKKRKGLIKGLEDRMGFGWASDPFSREEYIDWLKSLKPNHWKPSEEQIKSLRIALQTMPYSKEKENVLVILEELEKL